MQRNSNQSFSNIGGGNGDGNSGGGGGSGNGNGGGGGGGRGNRSRRGGRGGGGGRGGPRPNSNNFHSSNNSERSSVNFNSIDSNSRPAQSSNNNNNTNSNGHGGSRRYNNDHQQRHQSFDLNNRRPPPPQSSSSAASSHSTNQKPVIKSQSIVVNDPYWDVYLQLKKEPLRKSIDYGDTGDESDDQASSPTTGSPCSICLQHKPAISREEINALTPCNHQFCYECALRLIYISGSDECPICRQKFDKIIFSKQPTIDFDLYENVNYLIAINQIQKPDGELDEDGKPIESSESNESSGVKPPPPPSLPPLPKLPVNMQQYGMIFYDDPKIRDSVVKLISFTCRNCNKFSVESDFKDKHFYRRYSYHLFNYHKRSICELCVTNLKLFPVEFKDYSENEIKLHNKKGEMICDSYICHQTCDLCPGTCNFFNLDSLSTHCKQEHISCYVCDPRSQSIFFLDQESLNEHLINVHLVCQLCRVSGQIISFLTECELKRHALIDHKNDQFNMAQLIAESSPSNYSDTSTENQIITRREVFDEMDNLLRSRFQNSPIVVQSLDPTKENYQLNFPSIDGRTSDGQDVVVFPGNINSLVNANSSPVSYDSNFPSLSGDRNSVSRSKTIHKAVVKPPKAAATTFIKPKSDVSSKFKLSDFLKGPDSKPTKTKPKPKARHPLDSDSDDDQPKFDSAPYVDRSGQKYESKEVVQRPSSIKFIDAPLSSVRPAAPIPSAKHNFEVDTSEAFPALQSTGNLFSATSALPRNLPNSRRSKNKLSGSDTASNSGSQWSNVVATKQQAEKVVKNGVIPKAPLVKESLALKDESAFPTLDTLSLNGTSSGPAWPSRKPLASTIAKTGLPQDFGQFKLVESKKKSKQPKNTKTLNGGSVFDSGSASASTSVNNNSATSVKKPSVPVKFEFIPYIDLQHRNVQLIERIRKLMLTEKGQQNRDNSADDSVQFKSFKFLSSKFRKSQIPAEDYYEDCLTVLKQQDLNAIIYDLITLLPDIDKQNDLYRVHLDRIKQSGALPKRLPLYRCPVCTQLMQNSDKQFHINQHK